MKLLNSFFKVLCNYLCSTTLSIRRMVTTDPWGEMVGIKDKRTEEAYTSVAWSEARGLATQTAKGPVTVSYHIIFLIVGICFLFLNTQIQAAQILKVKGRKILIDREGERFKVGDKVYVFSKSGQKVGLIKIIKVKGEKLIGVMSRKSRAQVGWLVSKDGEFRPYSSSLGEGSKVRWGFLAGMGIHSVSALIIHEDEEKQTDMSGVGLTLKGLFDYKFSSSLGVRVLGGLDQLSASSSSDHFCGGGGDMVCKTIINYLSFDLWGRWVFKKGSSAPWLGLGVALLYPISKDTTAIDPTTVGAIINPIFGGGVNVSIGGRLIPISIQYMPYRSSSSLSAELHRCSNGAFILTLISPVFVGR